MTRNWLFVVLLSTVISAVSGSTYAAMVDPTTPPSIKGSQDNTFVLTAILIAPDHRMAVINGKILHVGDMINSTRLIGIDDTSVDIDGPAGKVKVFLPDFSVTSLAVKMPTESL